MSDRPYDQPPKHLAALDQRLRNLVVDGDLQLRTRRQIGYTAVIAALAAHACDNDGVPLFVVKGGVAVELLIGLRARATKDLDAAVRAPAPEIEPLLRDALAQGWDGFTFRLVSWEPIHLTGAHRGDIKLAYKGRPYLTVQFEAAPAEGEAGQAVQFVANPFVGPGDLGLTPLDEIPLVTLAYIIAQKLHACTDHSFEGWSNDRARDLIDILLVRRLLEPDDLPEVRRACVEVFRLRGKQPWPPAIPIPDAWPELFLVELAKAPGFEPTDVYAAAAAVGDLIASIDAA